MKSYLCRGFRLGAHTGTIEALERDLPRPGAFDIIALSHAALPTQIDLMAEIVGRSDLLGRVVDLSGRAACTVVAGAFVDCGGADKLSAVVAHRGQLVDIADSCSASEPFVRAGTVKVYRTERGSVAVLVGGDARVAFVIEKLKSLACLAVSLEPEYRPENERRIRHLSSLNALPVLNVSLYNSFLACDFVS